MPNKLRLDELSAEHVTVQSLLAQSREVGDFLGAKQFEQKLEQLDQQIAELADNTEVFASAALFFGGPKVIGARGIDAEFAGDALHNFQELVTKRFARQEVGRLGARGPIAGKDDSRLMVTGVTRGSFGFVLEEVGAQHEAIRTQLSEVVEDVVDIIKDVAGPEEEPFLDAVGQMDGRLLGTTRSFFESLASGMATLRIVQGDREVLLSSEAIQRAKKRTEDLEISEDATIELEGVLFVLPTKRQFEFTLIESGETVGGKITADASRAVGDQLASGGLMNPLGKRWRGEFNMREVQRPGKPAKRYYTLIRLLEELH